MKDRKTVFTVVNHTSKHRKNTRPNTGKTVENMTRIAEYVLMSFEVEMFEVTHRSLPIFLLRLDPGSCRSSLSWSSGIMSFPSAEVSKSSVALRLAGFLGSVA